MRTRTIDPGVSDALNQFLMYLRAHGIVFHLAEPEAIADEFREFFMIPCPMEVIDSSQLLNELDYTEVFLKKGLFRDQHIRGRWIVYKKFMMRIFVDAEPPSARWIKSLLHEIIEPLFKLSYMLWPGAPRPTKHEQEHWARRFAAMVKIPAKDFPETALRCGFDLEVLKNIYSDTLACSARQIRDLVMYNRVFCYARFEVVNNPTVHCPRLIPVLEQSNGICIKVLDAARSMQKRRAKGSMPDFNLPTYVQYKFIHPYFRELIPLRRPILIERIPGGSGWNEYRPDLFGENDLTVLLRPYGASKRGYYLLAVHPRDRGLLAPQTDLLRLERVAWLDWLFSMESDRYEAGPTEDINMSFEDLDESDEEPGDITSSLVRWPGVQGYIEQTYDSKGQGALFLPSELRPKKIHARDPDLRN